MFFRKPFIVKMFVPVLAALHVAIATTISRNDEPPTAILHFEDDEETTQTSLTEVLGSLLSNIATPNETAEILLNVTGNPNAFKAIDVHLTGLVLSKIAGNGGAHPKITSKILSNILKIGRRALRRSQATNLILESYDRLQVNSTPLNNVSLHLFVEENVVSFAVDLGQVDGFGGLVLLSNAERLQVGFLNQSGDLDVAIKDENFKSAVWFDPGLWEQMVDCEDKRLLVTVFLKNALFVEGKPTGDGRLCGEIIFRVLLPGLGEKLRAPILVVYKSQDLNYQDKFCSHWQFRRGKSRWVESGESELLGGDDVARCKFWQAKHFNLLTEEREDDSSFGSKYVDTMAVINCCLSVFGLCGIFCTAILFKEWRRNPGNKILINFCIAISLQLALGKGLYLYINNAVHVRSIKTLMGASFHYVMVAEFCWSLVLGLLHFRRLVLVFDVPSENAIFKYCLIGWGLPLVPVVAVLIFFPECYAMEGNGPSNALAVFIGLVCPSCVILLVNFVLFSKIVYEICKKGAAIERDLSSFVYQWKMIVLLFFTLSMEWIFGVLIFVNVYFAYLFLTVATLKGFITFLFFVVLNKSTRKLYVNAYRRRWRS